jgi:hypothetical protein
MEASERYPGLEMQRARLKQAVAVHWVFAPNNLRLLVSYSTDMNAKVLCPLLLGFLGFDLAAYGLATEQVGPDRDHPTVSQPEWPKGVVDLPRHSSRVYSIWVNGNEDFYFQGGLAQVNELLALYSKSRQRDHEVWIKRGNPQTHTFQKSAIVYNVHLQILSGIALAMNARGEGGDRSEPRLTVYVDDGVPAEQLVLPDNLILHSEVPGTNLKTKAAKPVRHPWYGRVQLGEGGAAAGPASDLRTQISLWEAGRDEEIKLARAGRDGRFGARFSEGELADLKSGKSWLTVTVGNWLTEAKPTDPRFPVERLGDQDPAEAVKIAAPKFYCGRILFEDGAAPKLEPAPWAGARITVDFPYAGSVEPDAEGYFRVFFTPEQYDKLKSDKPRKNIYIPHPLEKGRATARVAFPVSLLSQDQAQAGIVKIPRP